MWLIKNSSREHIVGFIVYFLVASALVIFVFLEDPSYNPTSLNQYFVLIPLGRCGGEASHCGYPDAFLLSFLLKEAARGLFCEKMLQLKPGMHQPLEKKGSSERRVNEQKIQPEKAGFSSMSYRE